VFLSTNQTKGGAAIAANRYFDAYNSVGGNASYAVGSVQKPGSGIVNLRHSLPLRKLVKFLFKREKNKTLKLKIPHEGYWSAPVSSRFRLSKINRLKPDLVCMNWINDDFLSIGEIGRIKVPVVWVFHDLWAVTGGCHYPGSCPGFQGSCGNCPKLKYPGENDWSRQIWQKKFEAWKHADMTILCPSNWMAREVKKSRLFGEKRIEVCPYSIETEIFKAIDSSALKKELGIRPSQKVFLFGAVNSMHDTRKGAHLLVEALEKLEGRVDPDELVFMDFGAKESPALEKVPFRVINLGFVREKEELAKYYAASTAFILPSLEDNLPNTVLESLACETPVVAFDIGGISDMIDHEQNGFLVDRIDTSLLADALENMVKMPDEQYRNMKEKSRRKIEEHFTREVVGERLAELFNSVVHK
ncbi:MAG: glycosyltransferase, partial [Bacteroidota bacterium]